MTKKTSPLTCLVVFLIAGSLISCLQQPKEQSPQQTMKVMKSTLSSTDSLLVYKSNFYETWWYIKGKYPEIADSAEGSYQNYLNRMMMNWGFRLYPDGNCERAAEALTSYVAVCLSDSSSVTPSFDPHWTCLGPDKIPIPKFPNTNQNGIGQMHRITFDPKYDGLTNKTIYACSSYGGLWKTTDDGLHWSNMNTDFLPFCSVADVCVNPVNTQQIFICTGYADDGFAASYGPNWSKANPIHTFGIYRSSNAGLSWESINNGFLVNFTNGGACRRMIINPNDPDQIFVATTRGIFRTNNATDIPASLLWENVLPFNQVNDLEFRGLAFKPGNAKTIYASGTDIYESNDGGNTWHTTTGSVYGIDLKNYPGFNVNRINITVTPAALERLYAYVEGYKFVNGDAVNGCLILMRTGQQWQILDERYTVNGTDLFSSAYLAIAVSPVNANKIYYGNTIVYGIDNWTPGSSFSKKANYDTQGFHADVHDLKFQPFTIGNPKLYCAHHGGISAKDFTSSVNMGWETRSEGLSVATIWAFDDGGTFHNFALTANQDVGTNAYLVEAITIRWEQVMTGDGYSARVNDANPYYSFFSGNENEFYRLDYDKFLKSFTTSSEAWQLPQDPIDKTRNFLRVVKTFPMVNHPLTNKMFFGFTEVLERQYEIPPAGTTPEQLWHTVSNIYENEQNESWRQIIELVISPSNADVFYLVTAGVESEQLQSKLYRLEKNTGSTGPEYVYNRITHPGENVSNTNLAIITGIAIDPKDENRIWITYTGYWPDYKVWYSANGGAPNTWVNADPKHQLYNLPVNAIFNHRGRIYIGTDAGVYTSDDNVTWTKYGRFPNVRVTEMKVNESINKLRVATYGRGLWEGDLPTP